MVQQITVAELSDKLARRLPLCLLDVRQPWEHEIAALPNSVLIPLDELVVRAGELAVPDGTLMVVYCHHGVRSLSAAAILERSGHANVVSLKGGIHAWSLQIDPQVPRY